MRSLRWWVKLRGVDNCKCGKNVKRDERTLLGENPVYLQNKHFSRKKSQMPNIYILTKWPTNRSWLGTSVLKHASNVCTFIVIAIPLKSSCLRC